MTALVGQCRPAVAADQAEAARVGLAVQCRFAVLAGQLREAGAELVAEHRLLEVVDLDTSYSEKR